MFGFSFSEVVLIGVVTLVAVGPQRLPGMLNNLAGWIRKLRKMTVEVRKQTGIDEMLRAEGLQGGLSELRSIMRGGGGGAPAPQPYRAAEDPYMTVEIDVTSEYPPEGPDAKGALPDDLMTEPEAREAMSKLPAQDPGEAQGKAEPPEAEAGMTLWEHLDELRGRLVKMILAFLVGAIGAWTQKEWLLILITKPFVEAWKEIGLSERPSLVFLAPAAQFVAYIRIAAIAGFVVALPILLYQIWAFIAPGLYSKEKRYAVPFVVASCGLFAGGGYFGWKYAFPLAFKFLLGMGERVGELDVKATITVNDYLDFVTRMLIAFGVAAELPIVVFFLSVAGIVTYRHLIKFFRYFLVLDFIVAAVITPPDMMSQLLLAIPLAMLYLLSIGVAWMFGRRPPKDVPAA